MEEEVKVITITHHKGCVTNCCWFWYVEWKDEEGNVIATANGCAGSKKEAKRQAGEAEIPTSKVMMEVNYVKNIYLEAPKIDAEVVNGFLCNFSAYNPDGEKIKFSTSEISQNTALWVCGLDCFEPALSERSELVIAMLKIWGVYKDGISRSAVIEIHNLPEEYFDFIADKIWQEITITIDEYGTLHWDIIV